MDAVLKFTLMVLVIFFLWLLLVVFVLSSSTSQSKEMENIHKQNIYLSKNKLDKQQ